jgi:shikimate dehydrogenase
MITNRHLLFDCIYNPEETLFLKKGRLQGASTQNGMRMLIGQANAAWKIWNKE